MRISDWSSDVCSSDLPPCEQVPARNAAALGRVVEQVALQRERVGRGAPVRAEAGLSAGPIVHCVGPVGRDGVAALEAEAIDAVGPVIAELAPGARAGPPVARPHPETRQAAPGSPA